MNKSVSVFLPTRKGSQRIKNKNTRPFAEFKNGLLELKLNQLMRVKLISEIVLSTNDEDSLNIAYAMSRQCSKLKIDHRPDNLASNTTNLIDLVTYVPKVTNSDHLLWTHVTSPFVDSADYDQAIEQYFQACEQGNDSLMSVKPFNNFLWSKEKGDLINRCTPQRWPRTQDLMELFEIDSAIFIAPRKVYEQQNDRVGHNPFLYQLGGIKSFDIDWEDDFIIAEALYEKLF